MAKLRFEIIKREPTGLAFQSLVDASVGFLGLLREIDQVMTGRYKGALKWYVGDLQSDPGSVYIDVLSRVRPPQKSKRNASTPDVSPKVADSLLVGFNNIQNLGVSPPYLSHYGLLKLDRMLHVLEQNGARAYRTTILDGGQSVELSRKAADTIGALIPTKRTTVGSVEGRLEAISIHQKRRFVVYDARTKKAIACDFNRELLDEVKNALGHRVLVAGRVNWNIKSEPNTVDVEFIRRLAATRLPTTLEMAGSHPDITEGLSTEEYLRSIRGD